MLPLSGERIHTQRPRSENSSDKPRSCPQRWHRVLIRDAKDKPHGVYRRSRAHTRLGDHIEHTAQKALHTQSEYYSRSNWYRSDSTTATLCRSRCEQQEHHVEQGLPLRPQLNTNEDASTQPNTPLSYTSEPATGSSCEPYHTPASTSLPIPDANEDFAVCLPVDRVYDDSVYHTNEGPSTTRTQQDFQDDETPVLFEDGGQAAAESQGHPNTEYHANLLAASEECRDLFKNYYKRAYGDVAKETESRTDAYWTWDQKRQQWFHEDPNTHSVVWFQG